jgi:dedicator of cytokinesis protein 3
VADVLPGLLTRSEVIDVRYLQISPLSSAIAEVIKATEHLRLLSKGKPGQNVE